MVTLTANDFEQGGLSGVPGGSYEDTKFSSESYIRSKNVIPLYGKPLFVRCHIPGYSMAVLLFDDDMLNTSTPTITTGVNVVGVVNSNGISSYAAIRLSKTPSSAIAPAEATAAQIGVSVNRFNGNAGTSNLTAIVAANMGNPRTGNIVLKSKAGSTTYNIAVTQVGVSGNISVDTSTFDVDYLTHPVTVDVTSVGTWSVSDRDPWITPTVWDGPSGTTAVTLKIADSTSNDARTGTIRFYDHIAQQYATVTVNQGGAPASIGLVPFRISGSKAGGEVRLVTYLSDHSWTMGSAPSWVAVSATSGASGQGTINVTFNTPNPGAARTGQLRIKNTVTNEIGICLITQEG